jgi:hypothetical protein
VVFAIRLRDEAIVVGVNDGRVENTVDVEETSDLVEFVFDFRAAGNLNYCRKTRARAAGEMWEICDEEYFLKK